MMNFSARMQPVDPGCIFAQEGYYVWCGAMFSLRGACWMIYSRWPRALGFEAWVTHSRLCLARAPGPDGPFMPVKELFSYDGAVPGEWRVMHNPAVLVQQGRVYLYFMTNTGSGDWWQHRNRQRIGLAWTDDPEGAWTWRREPLIDVTPGSVDSLMVSNPSAAFMPDGRVLMIYKAVSDNGPLPRGGSVICTAAIADHPAGPFRKTGEPLFVNPLHPWSVEDPCVWWEDDRFWVLAKDFQGYFTGTGEVSTALFSSPDGLHWKPDPSHPLACRNELRFANGTRPVHRLERPQLYMENGKPKKLVCACMPDADAHTSWNIRIPLTAPASPGCRESKEKPHSDL